MTNKKKMTFWMHIDELRIRVIFCLCSVFLFSLFFYFYSSEIYTFMVAPIRENDSKNLQEVFTSLTGPFFLNVSIAFFSGIFFSFPVLIYNILRFIYPAINKVNFLTLLSFMFFSVILFLLGVMLSYAIIIPFSVSFFISFNQPSDGIAMLLNVNELISFLISIMFFAGILFQGPIIAAFLSKIGVLKASFMSNKRRHAILIFFILAAFVSPPDIISQALLAIPMIFLYEICILITRIIEKKEGR